VDAYRDEDGQVPDGPIPPDLLVLGVKEHIRIGTQRPIAETVQLTIKLGAKARDLGRGDFEPTELFHHGSHFSRGNTHHVHLRNGQLQGLFAPASPFQDRKSTRLNSSHVKISYAVFCLK